MKMTHPAPSFPVEEWGITEETLTPDRMVLAETLFNLANGYIGTRATFEEGLDGYAASCEGTYINGLFLRQKIHYEESAHGFATHNHKMIPVPDGKWIRIYIDGKPYTPTIKDCVSHRRVLDFRRAILERQTRWKLDGDKEIEVSCKRLLSFADQHIMAIHYAITPVNFSAQITVESGLDAAYGGDLDKDEDDPRAGHLSITDSLDPVKTDTSGEQLAFLHRITASDVVIGSACRHHCLNVQPDITDKQAGRICTRFTASLSAGECLQLEKYVSYQDGQSGEEQAIETRLHDALSQAKTQGFDNLAAQQEAILQSFWKKADVAIKGDPALQQGIRFNLFHIFQSTGKDGRRSIGAKGLSGPGYDGHYFWDTEIYIIPFFVYTNPAIARALLSFRCSLLDASRKRAREMSHDKGALYAWRTIGGEECSAFFPAGTAQYHINAAIAYALQQYLQATDDWEFMREGGAEMLFETARIWADIGHFSKQKNGQFCINEVTGPDEYSAMVDNNFYTNVMARMHLRFAASVAKQLQQNDATSFDSITRAISLQEDEITLWQRAADKMYLPYDETLKINPQDDGFLSKPRWDFEHTPEENYPLLLHYHPLVIYRHQVLKQADVILAMALMGHEFSDEARRHNLEFYTPLTTHDSTLSTCIYSIESSRMGKPEQAYRFFEETARMDIDNRHHNTEYGLHTACMAGAWMSIVMGFAGMEIKEDALHFAPHLPQGWDGYHYRILYKGHRMEMIVNATSVICQLLEGETLTIHCYGDAFTLTPDTPLSIELKPYQEAA